MNNFKLRCIFTAAILFLMAPCIQHISIAGDSLLMKEELDFANTVGVGDYAYEINKVYAEEYGLLKNELGDRKETWRPAGTSAEHKYAKVLKAEMKKIGLEKVAMEPFKVHAWNYGGAWVKLNGNKMLACGYPGLEGTTSLSPAIAPGGVLTGEMVYVGMGTKADYERVGDVTGKIVLVDVSENEMYWLQWPHYEAFLHGAAGIICNWLEYQPTSGAVVTHDSECVPDIVPTVNVSKDDFENLKAAAGTTEVSMYCDSPIDYNGKSYNVVGYIPGKIKNKYIIVADHYDKHWYGASDDGAGVARLMGIAKGLLDSKYKPVHTLIFVAHGAEEYGWTDTEYDWAIGAWYQINKIHPEWVGKTLLYCNLEAGGTKGAKSVRASGSPGTFGFSQSLLPLFDEYFTKNDPFKVYYTPSSASYNLPSTWADQFPYGSAGMEIMNIGSSKAPYWPTDYHTQYDTMEYISGESLAMSIIANGIAVIRMDRSSFIPYELTHWGSGIEDSLDDWAIGEVGLDTNKVRGDVELFKEEANKVWNLINQKGHSKKSKNVNKILLKTAKDLNRNLITVGGYVQPMYPFEHYQNDAYPIKWAIDALNGGDVDYAIEVLTWIYGMWEGRHVSRETYQKMDLDRRDESISELFWAGDGRLASYIDVYDEWASLVKKQESGDTDYSSELASLQLKYDNVVANLDASLNNVSKIMKKAASQLKSARKKLQ